jgi:hypothetical protein
MKEFFAPNLTRAGRLVSAGWGVTVITIAGFLLPPHPWAALLLSLFGVFALYEAARSWCIIRACGINTRI